MYLTYTQSSVKNVVEYYHFFLAEYHLHKISLLSIFTVQRKHIFFIPKTYIYTAIHFYGFRAVTLLRRSYDIPWNYDIFEHSTLRSLWCLKWKNNHKIILFPKGKEAWFEWISNDEWWWWDCIFWDFIVWN